MLHKLSAALLLGLGAVSLATTEETSEPPLRIQLELAGFEHELLLGEDFKIELDGKTYHGHIGSVARRRFEAHGVRFEYPSNFTWECDTGDGMTSYFLDGPSTALVVNVFEQEIDLEEYREALALGFAEELDPLDIELSQIRLRLGGETYKGTRLDVITADMKFHYDFVAFTKEDVTLVLDIQSLLDEEGEVGGDCVEALELLAETFELR